MSKSTRSRRKKKSKGGDRSERKTNKSERKKKGAKSDIGKKKKKNETVSKDQTNTGVSTGAEGVEKKEKEQWSGDETAKKLVASGAFNTSTITSGFKELSNPKPSADMCSIFKNNPKKSRAPDWPIADNKLIKLSHAPGNFICAAKVDVPEFNRTMIVTQIPDVTVSANIEDFWRMIFQEEIVSIVIAVMPLECSVTLQQLFPLLSGTFSNHGKMFLNNKKVDSAVAMTAYTLEVLPDGCSNSLLSTVYHLHNWKQKQGLENVGELVTTVEKVLKTNENTVLMSMNGIGRAGTMLTLFTSMLSVQKSKEVNPKEILIKLRGERSGLVENADQFNTVHRAMALWFKNKCSDEEVQKKLTTEAVERSSYEYLNSQHFL